MRSRGAVEEFLAQKRIAVVGVSRDGKKFPNTVFRKLKENGYEVFPVNPNAEQVEGVTCHPSVSGLPVPVDGVLVMLPGEKAPPIVQECQTAGIRRVWLYRESPEAGKLARQAGMTLVEGVCPHMFFGGFPHNLHRFFTRLDP